VQGGIAEEEDEEEELVETGQVTESVPASCWCPADWGCPAGLKYWRAYVREVLQGAVGAASKFTGKLAMASASSVKEHSTAGIWFQPSKVRTQLGGWVVETSRGPP